MLHKTRARNARPYGHGGVMRSYFFLQHCRGAHRAPVIGICAKFRICSFTVFTEKGRSFFLRKNSLFDFRLNQRVRITSRFTRRRYSALAVSETSSAITNAHHTPVTSPVTRPMAYAHGMSTTS